MPNYEYPQVPRTSQAQPHPPPEEQSAQIDNRFSFLPTPAEARGYSWHRGRTDQRHTEIPPLPQLPQHLHTHQDVQQPYTQQDQHEQNNPVPPVLHPPAPAYSHYPVHPSGQPYLVEATSHPPSDTSTLYRPSTSHTLDQQHDHHLSQDNKDDPTMHYTSMPARTSPPPPQHRAPSTTIVEPDLNPLSPTTPTKPHLPHPNTTNITILPPLHQPTIPVTNSYIPLPQPTHGGPWHTSLFSCSEPSTCLTALFCPCIIYGRTQYHLTRRSERQDPTNMLGYSACNGSCVAFGVLCGFNAVLAAIQKTRVRKAYGMGAGEAGGVVDDCVRGVGCCCCSVAQDEKEVRWREEAGRRTGLGIANGGGQGEGYVPVDGMAFLAPPR